MINTLSYAVNLLFNLLEYAIFIDVILSWVYRGRGNALIDILHIFTEPFMGPARKLQQRFVQMSMLDFSPIIAYFILLILRNIVNYVLRMFM
jgi:YggT family protein